MATNIISVVKGKKKDFNLDIDKGDDPFDLSGVDSVKVCFPGESAPVELSSTVPAELTITNAALGKLSGSIPSAKSAGLAVGEEQNVQVEVITAGEPEAVILEGCLTVVEAIC